MAVKTYNAADVSVIVGTRRIQNLAPDSFVTVSKDEQAFTKQVGAAGEVTRSTMNNRAGTIVITTQQASDDNAFLQELANTDQQSGAGIVPIKVQDNSGTYVAVVEEAWIQQDADAEFGREAGTREWTFDTGPFTALGGGN